MKREKWRMEGRLEKEIIHDKNEGRKKKKGKKKKVQGRKEGDKRNGGRNMREGNKRETRGKNCETRNVLHAIIVLATQNNSYL